MIWQNDLKNKIFWKQQNIWKVHPKPLRICGNEVWCQNFNAEFLQLFKSNLWPRSTSLDWFHLKTLFSQLCTNPVYSQASSMQSSLFLAADEFTKSKFYCTYEVLSEKQASQL